MLVTARVFYICLYERFYSKIRQNKKSIVFLMCWRGLVKKQNNFLQSIKKRNKLVEIEFLQLIFG